MKRDSVIPQIKDALQQPIPDPKYKLWQHTKDGQICGFYWLSIDSAWITSSIPGWWYMVTLANQGLFIHEADVEVVE